jgi:hypothetical protein
MADESFLAKTILQEIQGKNQAVHEYDRMIWAIRTGLLTVFFAAWGLLIKSFTGQIPAVNLQLSVRLMSMITACITTGALIIDLSYIRRKYKVVKGLNKLYDLIREHNEPPELHPELFEDVLRISGTSTIKKDDYADDLKGTGYYRDLITGIFVYIFPVLANILGFMLVAGLK